MSIDQNIIKHLWHRLVYSNQLCKDCTHWYSRALSSRQLANIIYKLRKKLGVHSTNCWCAAVVFPMLATSIWWSRITGNVFRSWSASLLIADRISIFVVNIEQTLSQNVLLYSLDGKSSAKLWSIVSSSPSPLIHHREKSLPFGPNWQVGDLCASDYVYEKLGCKLAATFELKHENEK